MNRWWVAGLVAVLGAGALWFLSRDDRSRGADAGSEPGISGVAASAVGVPDPGVAVERTGTPEPAVPRPFELRGVVEELADSPPGRRPAAFVEVAVEGIGSHARFVTDARGRFAGSMEDGGHRPVMLTAVVAGDEVFRACSDSLLLRTAADSPEEFHLVRAPHGDLHGIAVDPRGSPLADVAVQFQRAECRSDAHGRFAVAAAAGDLVSAGKPGHRLLLPRGPHRAPAGGFEPLRLTLVRLGALGITVNDATGAPVADAAITVRLSPSELAARDLRPQPETPFGRTDAAGRVDLPAVWAEVFLEIAVKSPGGTFPYRSGQAGLLETSGVHGIQVPADGRLECSVLLPAMVSLKGQVFTAEHTPAAFPWIELRAPPAFGAPVEARCTGDEHGRFECWLPASDRERTLSVRAADRSPGNVPFAQGMVREVALPAAPAEPPFLELELAPLGVIHGLVLAAGKPCAALCRAVPAGASYRSDVLESQEVRTGNAGEFYFVGLLEGTYDVVVMPERSPGGVALAVHRFPGIEAGSRGVVLEIPEEPAVRVTVALEAPQGIRGSGLQLLRALAREPGETRVPGAGERFGSPAPVPTTLPLRPFTPWRQEAVEVLMDADSAYVSTVRVAYGDPGRHALVLAPGDYWILAFAEDACGIPYAPASTGALHLGPGEYEFEVCLQPQVPVSGRWSGAATADQWIGLVDAAGRPLATYDPVQGFSLSRPVGAHGEFRLPGVPVGLVGLAAGTLEQWESGVPRFLRWIEVSEENARIELQ